MLKNALVKGLLWFFMLSMDFTIGTCLIVISMIEALDLANPGDN